MTPDPIPRSSTRRAFLAGGAAALGTPAIVRADQPVNLRFQSTWPTKDIFHEFALDFAKKVNDISGGHLRVEMLPAGAVVKAFDVLDAVHKGVIDGGHGVCAYWHPKNSAFSLFGTGPAIGFDGNMLLAWMEYGGGRQLYNELMHKVLGLDIEGMLYGPMGTQPLGWFRRPINNADDLRGMRYRTIGLAADMMRELGMTQVRLAGQEIVQALERGQLDAAEFNNPSSDRALGFPEVSKLCYLQSYHQPSEVFEVLINKRKFDALSALGKSALRLASQAASADMSWKAADRFAADYHEMRTRMGVRFLKTPDSVLRAQLEGWRRVVQVRSAENPIFARIMQSQQEFARRTMRYQLDATVSQAMAYEFWYGAR